MNAVLGRCRQQSITQFDLKCRIFDTLVEPVMSYGSQVWGPEVFASQVASTQVTRYSKWCAADRVHVSFLRMMAGAGNGCVEVLLRDFNRRPVMHHWVILAARWFMALKCMTPDRLAHCAWVADIELMLLGCRECWTYKLLHTMSHLGVIDGQSMFDETGRVILGKEGIMLLQLPPKSIKAALQRTIDKRWTDVVQPDPRMAPSVGIEMCTHAAWVLGTIVDGRGPHSCSKHLKLCVSFVVLQCLARLRLGLHGLEIRLGRMKRDVVPRPERLCRLCSTVGAPFYGQRQGEAGVEDVKHFVLECPAYGHIRSRYSDVFGVAPDVCMDMLAIFDTDHQDQLAHAVYTMTKFRDQCLLCPQGAVITVDTLQLVVEEDVELLRMS
jgi:hypothetical protein